MAILEPEQEAHLKKVRVFMRISHASLLPPHQQRQLAEILTRDWDGRGLAREDAKVLFWWVAVFNGWYHHDPGCAWNTHRPAQGDTEIEYESPKNNRGPRAEARSPSC